jgi:predicted nucleic acid-binding protein
VIVVDASALLDGVLDAAGHPEVAACLSGTADSLAAPDLLDVEALSVLRRWEQRREITARRAQQALEDVHLLPIIRYPARALTDRAWRLRHNLTAYDAQYVALAQALPATLLTTDARMAAAAIKAHVEIAGPTP